MKLNRNKFFSFFKFKMQQNAHQSVFDLDEIVWARVIGCINSYSI